MTPARESWFEDDAGPIIRPYAIVRGRSGGVRYDLDVVTILATTRYDRGLDKMEPEHQTIARLCSRPHAVAEVAAKLRLPLTITKILIGDLIHDGYVSYRPPATDGDVARDIDILQAVLNGIRSL